MINPNTFMRASMHRIAFALFFVTLCVPIVLTGCGADAGPGAGATAAQVDEHADAHTDEHAHEEGVNTEIVLAASSLASLNLESVLVRDMPVGAMLDFPARIVPVPDQEAMVTTLLPGRIEEVFINEGERVSTGQAVARITGPQLGDLVAELRHARADLDRQQRLADRDVGIEKNLIEAKTALDAARQHLRAIGLSAEEVAEIADGGSDAGSVHLRAPIDGIVLARDATVGGPVSPGSVLFHIARLSPIWVEADVYERDLPMVSQGTAVQVQSVSGSGRMYEGTIRQILPRVDTERRVVTIRVQLPNSGQELKPGMYGTVSVATAGSVGPSLPVDAVLTDGTQSYVIVADNDSTFRRVDVGASADAAGYVPVPELVAGSRVVTTGAFQIHSAMQGVEAGHAH